jgi:hypothetical protein
MKTHRLIVVSVLLVLAWSAPAWADQYTDTIAVFKKADAVKPFFENCYGYAVFPTIGKGGIGVGGAYGTGQVYAQGVPTGMVKMFKGTIGFQLGGQAFSQLIFFEDKRAFEEFTGGEFEFDAGVSAVAITAGAQAKAGTGGATAGASAGPATGTQAKTSYRKGMAVFVHAKGGLMYEATVGGRNSATRPISSLFEAVTRPLSILWGMVRPDDEPYRDLLVAPAFRCQPNGRKPYELHKNR